MVRHVDAACFNNASIKYNEDLASCAFRKYSQDSARCGFGIMSHGEYGYGGFLEYDTCTRRAALDFKLASLKCQKEMDD